MATNEEIAMVQRNCFDFDQYLMFLRSDLVHLSQLQAVAILSIWLLHA